MSDDQVRWAALETALASHEVRARIQAAVAAQRAWVRRMVEVQTDPDWPETAITATTISLGLVFSWAATTDVTVDEVSRITARLSQLIDAAPSVT